MRQAVILAGGKGIRMLPLTKYVPKPMIKINNKPFLWYLLKNLEKAKYERVLLVVGHKKNVAEEFFMNTNFKFEKEVIHQSKRLGTGHAIKIVEKSIKNNFVVIMGDNLYSEKDLKDIKWDNNFSYVFAVKHKHPERFGVLRTKGDYLIEIQEKPEIPPTNLINSGLYKFTPEIFCALKKIKKSKRGEYELTAAISLLAEDKKVKVEQIHDYWIDLGRLEDVPKVSESVKKNF
ncbi:MAG: NTP transferase domain-containing protein [Nanoarchaeota archaeon]|nr:NTP transferase domain-containing protein [Nanoarchaeota archaeon]MBU1854406.1 NTP transferase domain-containing protein [Nanoarchaeota archaeon]